MTTYTFAIDNNSKKNNSNNTFNGSTNYSKILDSIIATNIMDSNPYLKAYMKPEPKCNTIIINNGHLKTEEPSICKAANFLANLFSSKHIIFGKTYKLPNGTSIIFYDDEIQIGYETYKYSDFKDFSFLNNLSDSIKTTILDIYISKGTNLKITIK